MNNSICNRGLADPRLSARLPQGEFKLGDVKNGTLPAVFMVGLLIASLVYSELTKTYNAFRLIGTSDLRQLVQEVYTHLVLYVLKVPTTMCWSVTFRPVHQQKPALNASMLACWQRANHDPVSSCLSTLSSAIMPRQHGVKHAGLLQAGAF